MTCRVHCQQHMLTLRDSVGVFIYQGFSSGINKMRKRIYFRFGNRRPCFVRGIKTKLCCAERLCLKLSWCGFHANVSFFVGSIFDKHARSPLLLDHRESEWRACYAYRPWGVPLGVLPSWVKLFSCAMDAVYDVTFARSTPASGKENLYFSKCHVENDPLGFTPITALGAVVHCRSSLIKPA